MGAIVTGDRELDKKLATMSDKAQKKVLKPAIAAGLRVEAKAMKAAIPANMKDAKKAIGSRFNKSKRNGEEMAKVGAGVGIKSAKIRKDAAKQKTRRTGRPGVGIGARNIQWFILGTAERSTGSTRIRSKSGAGKRKLTGNPVHSTGRMPPQMSPVKEGFRQSESAALEKIIDVAKSKIAALARESK